eukprot:TRINITY_DN28297_c0_g1_i1.p1 TRINITY_DN28297_c0_g1~~TRINITY_DN28297_c0_g1_i1.p1  ORF type:complete len:334 (-),score=79.94 TRINITY_DN28297_c0_g1_i1:37-1038(-)
MCIRDRTWLCAVAYVILLGDIGMPVLQLMIHGMSDHQRDSHDLVSCRSLLQVAAVLLTSPFCFADSLAALKFTSLTSVLSITLLVVAMVVNASQEDFGGSTVFAVPGQDHGILWVGGLKSFTAFSIISVSFLCHFNALSVTRSVSVVTRPRMYRLVYCTMGTCCILYMLAAISGYLNFRDVVCGNILLNYDNSNQSKLHLITVGRVGLFFALLCSFPLLVHPCRENVERLASLLSSSPVQQPPAVTPVALFEGQDLTAPAALGKPFEYPRHRRVLHVIVILVTATVSAVFIPGVQVVWTFMGLSLIHISEPTRLLSISYAVFCLKKKKKKRIN